MENAMLEYFKSWNQLHKYKNVINYFSQRTDKDGFEYDVLTYAKDEIKKLEKQINKMKKEWNIS